MRVIAPRPVAVAALEVFLLFLAAGCDVRPLQQDELSRRPRPQPAANTDTAPPATPDAAFEVRPGADAAIADTAIVDVATADTATDVRAGCPATPCLPFELCNPTTMVCTPRTGSGFLSGSTVDGCTGRAVSARIGIAGRRQCSADGKGAYFFDKLPEGNLALVAFKEGYKHFEIAVAISSGGTIQNVVLQPDTTDGCVTSPADVACLCDMPGCP